MCLLTIVATSKEALAEIICDASVDDCRTPLLSAIGQEQVGIDVSFWFMEDARYAAELVRRAQAGVPVRVIVDPRANATYPLNAQILAQLQQGGIAMRQKIGGGILHRKFVVLVGQNAVEFSGANYSPDAFVPTQPYANYVDESIYFSDDAAVVNSFKRVFDDMWTATSGYANYANVVNTPTRAYPLFSIDPELNFPPGESYATRALKRYAAETVRIDIDMYRITDRRHTDAMLAAVARGVPVRVYTDRSEYRDPTRLWHAYNVDRLWRAGIPVKVPAHAGINHQKSILLYGQGLTIFGSSNWTSPSDNSQAENNYFTTKPWVFNWFVAQFERKWNNTNPAGVAETEPFTPSPPDAPSYLSPANGETGVTPQKLVWYGGPWAHVYDVYFGTDPNPPLIAADVELGPSESPGQTQSVSLPFLTPGTTYYWRIVSKTAALLPNGGSTWTFTTAGLTPSPGQTGGVQRHLRLWWQDQTNGLIATSVMTGTTLVSGQIVGRVPDTNWKIVGTGDINGDGQIDLFWQHLSSGTVGAWLMAGTTLVQTSFLSPSNASSIAWRVRAVGDFNGDGRPDLLWQHTTDGRIGIWLMNGTSAKSMAIIGRVSDTRWKIVGAADVNGDGHTDILWQHSTGIVGVWFMNGTRFVESAWFTPSQASDNQWKLELAADLNGDGKPDLVWQHEPDGIIGAWLMDGTVTRSTTFFNPAQTSDTSWKIVGGQ